MKTNNKVSKAVRIKQLERKNQELQAQLAYQHHFVSNNLDSLNIDKMTGSAVILELRVLGGAESIGPVAIRDGLSDETIAAIKVDLARSFELCTVFKP